MDKSSVFPPKPNVLDDIFHVKKPIIATLHLKPLPGSPQFQGPDLCEAIDAALYDSEMYLKGGVDSIIVENGGDLPFAKPENIGYETVAAMTRIANMVRQQFHIPIGINCLANAVIPALAVAMASDALFIRSNQWVNAYVANEGLIEGAAATALRYRSLIRSPQIKILADVHVKHGSHSIVADRSLQDQTRDAIFFDADVLIATGNRTGDETPMDELIGIKENTDLPVIIGSGMNDKNVKELFKVADGAIVGTFFKNNSLWWKPVELDRVRRFMDEVQKFR